MSRDASNQVFRQLRAIFVVGPVGGMPDAQLVERFLTQARPDAEEAFAALVARHGPMVMGVCRRMLAGSADSDDAFQAVFLVLARRASSIARPDALKSWLYGVAVRTAKEARRRAARRKSREGAPIDLSIVGAPPDDGLRELLTVLDEELDRLPSHFRDPLKLCELAGTPRHEAARQLKLPEGTLSSRIARGRLLLRDRLTRRGIALGSAGLASLFSRPADAALPATLADSTVRLSLAFARPGAASPTAALLLAERILSMTPHAPLKLALAAATLIGAVGLSLAWAARPPRIDPPKPAPSKPVAVLRDDPKPPDADKPEPRTAEIRGIVVDEAGKPVSGAEVLAQGYVGPDDRATTAKDGTFTISVGHKQVDGVSLLASTDGGARAGTFKFGYNLTLPEAEAPPQIVLKACREVTVHVADANKVPVVGASVEAVGNFMVVSRGTTDPGGSATLKLPPEAKVEWIYAVKPIQGFDYAEYGPIDEQGRSLGGVAATELPESVSLGFEGTRTAQIKAVDREGKPVAGVDFTPWLLWKPGRRSEVNVRSLVFKATTDANGIATFDWLPLNDRGLTFWPRSEGFCQRRVELNENTRGPITALMTRTEAMRGRVVHADGSPARGIRLRAIGSGSGNGSDTGQHSARTSTDGSYEMEVNPGEAYVVSVEDSDWAAKTRFNIIVGEDSTLTGVDFKLTRGVIIQGTVTVGPDRRPSPKQQIRLDEIGSPRPDYLKPVITYSGNPERISHSKTDAKGHYSFRVTPGEFTLWGPPRTKEVRISVKNKPEIVHDFHMPRPEKGPLVGRVVIKGMENQAVAGAIVDLLPANAFALPSRVTADSEGRFQIVRDLDPTYLCARSSDMTLGAMTLLGPEDPEVVIAVAPTASASGILLDGKGDLAIDQKVSWGRRVLIDEKHQQSMYSFGSPAKTDKLGRFNLPGMVVGEEYDVWIQKGDQYQMAAHVSPKAPGPIDLGTIRAGAYHPPQAATTQEMSSFTKDAPDAGAVAPEIEATDLQGHPLKLADFKGKYVLLDFWATWCGPCIGEIPHLQAIHDAHGKDGRLVILSLSVDEKIDEPRKFQEKRGLPWTQAFLGGGVHGATPGQYGIRAIPAFILVGPDGKIISRGMRGEQIQKEVAKALRSSPKTAL